MSETKVPPETITLTLTREQAKLLASEDKIYCKEIEHHLILGKIQEQIEEKLK